MHQAMEVTQVRPIAVGHAIYRLWGRIRLQQIVPFFANHLPPFQSGGCAGADLESMLVSLSLDLPGDTYQVGLALDFSNAFDPTDAYCALQALKSWGLPDSITNLLGNHWLDHFPVARWSRSHDGMLQPAAGGCVVPAEPRPPFGSYTSETAARLSADGADALFRQSHHSWCFACSCQID